MTAPKHQPIHATTAVPSYCEVSANLISEMYDRFDSGFFDGSTCNAVALALSRIFGEKVRVYRKGGSVVFQTREEVEVLPKSVEAWLDQVDRGIPVKPFRFRI